MHGRVGPTAEWAERKAQIIAKVAALVQGIQAAQFPVSSLNADCTGNCSYNTVCRINQVRSLEKVWTGV